VTSSAIAPPATDRARAAFLGETLDVLWPPAQRGDASPTELMVLPRLKRPRLVVPLNRRAAASAVRRYGEPRSLRSRLGMRGLSLLLRSGLGEVLLRDRVRVPDGEATIESYLSERLGAEIKVSMYLGPPRANRKPVLHLFAPDGAAVGVAKVGVSPLAQDLVRDEGDTLRLLAGAGLEQVIVPSVMLEGEWNGMPVLVLGPLPVNERRVPLPARQRWAAITEIAGVRGWERAQLAGGRYLATLRERVARADATPDRERLSAAIDRLATGSGATALTFGAWHGDWSPWNIASTRHGLLVWDWERFGLGVPFGYDALHNRLQRETAPGRTDPLLAARECVTGAATLLEPLGVDVSEARLTALAYLAELTARYLIDRQADLGGRLSAASAWLIPALESELEGL
jgi:hypothetical protein